MEGPSDDPAIEEVADALPTADDSALDLTEAKLDLARRLFDLARQP